MKYLLIFIITISIFSSCKKEEDYIWDYSDFEKNVDINKTKLAANYSFDKQYAFFNLSIELDNNKTNNGEVIYYIEFDSITASSNNNPVDIFNTIYTDRAILYNKESIKESNTVDITIWGSWYYKDIKEPKYTDGSPVFIKPVSEIISIDINPIIPYTILSRFKESVLQNKTYYIPELELVKQEDSSLLKLNVEYKYELSAVLSIDNNIYDVEINYKNNTLIQLLYDGLLEKDENYKFKVIAHWKRKCSSSVWMDCVGFDETLELNTTPTDNQLTGITKNDFQYTYPLYRQLNFLKDEYNKGYFIPKDETLKKYMENNSINVKFYNTELEKIDAGNLSYNNQLCINEYFLPLDELENDKIYKVGLYANNNQDSALYSYHFRTSHYNTFIEKWEEEEILNYSSSFRTYVAAQTHYYSLHMPAIIEGFDKYDNNNFVQVTSEEFPEIMDGTQELAMYSMTELDLTPPLDAIYFKIGKDYLLTDEQIKGGDYEQMNYRLVYYVTCQARLDYLDNWYVVSEAYPNLPTIWDNISNSSNAFILKIPSLDISYVLPGIGITTTIIENYEIPGWDESWEK